MKKFLLLLVWLPAIVCSQNSDTNHLVAKSIFGVQTGVLGVWANHELGLSNTIALRSELGLDTGLFGGLYYKNNVNFILYPTLTLEPRLYYNLQKRLDKGKTITKNSGNFVALKIHYAPDWFTITNYSGKISIAENYAMYAKWGIKRIIGKHFTYETGLGFGYRNYFLKQYGYTANQSEAALDVHLRIGYTF